MSDRTKGRRGAAPGSADGGAAGDADGASLPPDAGDRALLELIDRLTDLLNRSDLTELEVEAGGTGLVLRKHAALAPVVGIATSGAAGAGGAAASGGIGAVATGGAAGAAPGAQHADPAGAAGAQGAPGPAPERPSVKAPLTGIFYTSPSPGAPPYVQAGGEVIVGQVIGLIEAMKLFNEIKSDLAGRVVRVVPESGTLVKAKQPLIEVEPL
ncbi:MAG: hypothetical protein RL338_536 [Chloroflexota bacterium]